MAAPTSQESKTTNTLGGFTALRYCSTMIEQRCMFQRDAHVPMTHLGYFRTAQNAFYCDLRNRYKRSAKEWKTQYVLGVSIELALTTLSISMRENEDNETFCKLLEIIKNFAKATVEVFAMRGQYFRDITMQELEVARQRCFLVKERHDAVLSESYRTAKEALTIKIEIESVKQLAELKLEQLNGRRRKGYKEKQAQASK